MRENFSIKVQSLIPNIKLLSVNELIMKIMKAASFLITELLTKKSLNSYHLVSLILGINYY